MDAVLDTVQSSSPTVFDQRKVDEMVRAYATDHEQRHLKDTLLKLGPAGLPALFVALDQLTGYPRFLVMELIESVVDHYRDLSRTALRWSRQHQPLILGQTRAFLIYCWGKTLRQIKRSDLSELFSMYEDDNALVRRTVLNVLAQHADASFADELSAFLRAVIRDPDILVQKRCLQLSGRLGMHLHTPWILKLRHVFSGSAGSTAENSLSIFS